MTEQKPQKMGRPRLYHEARQRFTIELPADLLARIEQVRTAGQTRTAWIETAIREKLERDGVTTR